ncbi:uncharacterized protein PAF06_020266 [Gastrophryne carolinensis]
MMMSKRPFPVAACEQKPEVIDGGLLISKMNKEELTEKILNHALGIIYLLTGEEYVVVKKNSPHGTTQELIGDVPVKCGDISIHFSMEEWDYIEEHKNIYKDVDVRNGQALSEMKIKCNLSVDNQEEEIDCVSVHDEEKETETCEDASNPLDQEPNIIAEDANAANSTGQVEETQQSNTLLNKQEDIIDITAEDANAANSTGQVEETQQSNTLLKKQEDIIDITDDSMLVRTMKESHPGLVPEESQVRNAYISQVFPGENYGSFTNDPYDVNVISEPFHHKSKPFSLVESFLPENNEPWENVHLARRKSRKQDLHSKTEHIEYETIPDEDQFNDFDNDLTYTQSLGLPEEPTTPFICGECGKCFISEPFLAEHLKKHSIEKPHRCHECGREFEYRSRLVVHLRTHSGDRPHKCEECGKDFNYRSRLIVHQRKHTGVKPHKCHQCGKQFDYRSHLLRHLRTHI